MSKILIVEDDVFLQSLISRKLQPSGFQILNTDNGTDAIQMAVSDRPDLIVLDIMLPETDGFEVLEQMSKRDDLQRIPVIVFSNLSEQKHIERAKGLGASAFLLKSQSTLDDLEAQIKKVLLGLRPASSFFKSVS